MLEELVSYSNKEFPFRKFKLASKLLIDANPKKECLIFHLLYLDSLQCGKVILILKDMSCQELIFLTLRNGVIKGPTTSFRRGVSERISFTDTTLWIPLYYWE